MRKKYDLILIDSGYCRDNNASVDVYINDNGKWNIKEDDDLLGHGTGVLSLICNEYKGQFAVFKAFDLEIQDNLPQIVSALQYIYNHLDCKIVQMSFGVRGYYKELEDICFKLYERNVLIVAAFDNCGAMSFPAAFDFVIGVDGNPYCKTKDDFRIFNNGIVDIQAKSGYQIVSSNANDKGFQVVPGNSFATSYVSLKLLKTLPQKSDKEGAMKVFYRDYSMNLVNRDYTFLKSDLAIFPMNKENYSLLNYCEKSIGRIVDFYDIKYSSNVGRKINSFKQKEFVVKNIEKCDWDSFETMIIGHVRELSSILGKNIKKELLEKCLKNRKNVFCYDSYDLEDYKDKFVKEGLSFAVADDYKFNDMFGKLYQIKTPILAVLGTNKRQGKFTVQMQIRDILEENNVKVGQLSTEPLGIILGSDEILPSGYDSRFTNETGSFMIQAYNKMLHRIDVKEYDIIITGAQSGFLPHTFFNTKQINIDYYPFLYGVIPDGVVLSVNHRDSIDYILKTIKTIENVISTKVILIALYAFNTEVDNVINVKKELLSEEEISEFMRNVEEKTGISVVVSGDNRYDNKIFKEVVRYFCEE